MRTTGSIIALIFICHVLGYNQVFRGETATGILKPAEMKIYKGIKENKHTLRVKLISFQPMSLANGEVNLEFFDQRGFFVLEENADTSVWKGRGKGFDRIFIRNQDGKYIGHAMLNGRRYVITPISKGYSALYEQDNDYACGVSNARE